MMSQPFLLIKFFKLTIILLLLITFTGCANISLNKIVSVDTDEQENYIAHATGKDWVQVYRQGEQLVVKQGMALQKGDEIQTSQSGLCVIKFKEHGIVVIDVNTRVKIGSLEVFFGKVFADVRGLFSTYSNEVSLGVEGTQFLFEANKNQSTRVMVSEGVVKVNSRQNKWAPVKIEQGKGFRSTRLNPDGQPRIIQANPVELEAIPRKIKLVTNAREKKSSSRSAIQDRLKNNRRKKRNRDW